MTNRPMTTTTATGSAQRLSATVDDVTMTQIVETLDHVPQTGAEFLRGVRWLAMRERWREKWRQQAAK